MGGRGSSDSDSRGDGVVSGEEGHVLIMGDLTGNVITEDDAGGVGVTEDITNLGAAVADDTLDLIAGIVDDATGDLDVLLLPDDADTLLGDVVALGVEDTGGEEIGLALDDALDGARVDVDGAVGMEAMTNPPLAVTLGPVGGGEEGEGTGIGGLGGDGGGGGSRVGGLVGLGMMLLEERGAWGAD